MPKESRSLRRCRLRPSLYLRVFRGEDIVPVARYCRSLAITQRTRKVTLETFARWLVTWPERRRVAHLRLPNYYLGPIPAMEFDRQTTARCGVMGQ
jgi:hypothetical protein